MYENLTTNELKALVDERGLGRPKQMNKANFVAVLEGREPDGGSWGSKPEAAAAETTTAVIEEPTPKAKAPVVDEPSEQFEAGIYQLWVDDECKASTIDLKGIVSAFNPRKRRTGHYSFVVGKELRTYMITCPKCHAQWMPEQPLRPAEVLRLPEGKKWQDRFAASHICKDCKEKYGLQIKGQPMKGAGGEPVRFQNQRQVVYLTAEERQALEDHREERIAVYEFQEKLDQFGRKRVFESEVKPETLPADWESLEDKYLKRLLATRGVEHLCVDGPISVDANLNKLTAADLVGMDAARMREKRLYERLAKWTSKRFEAESIEERDLAEAKVRETMDKLQSAQKAEKK